MMPSAPAVAQCRLCAAPTTTTVSQVTTPPKAEIPLRIDIIANLDFSQLALLSSSGGEARIDPHSDRKTVSGDITDLGGMSLQGEGQLHGEPGRYVRVYLPEQIFLSTPNGASAKVVDIASDLPAQARLDAAGNLSFKFGGRLRVSGTGDGQFRGRIAITAEYE